MKWFRHLSTAHNDSKLRIIRQELGMAGIGIWWTLVELLAEQYQKGKPLSMNLSFSDFYTTLRVLRKNLESTLELFQEQNLLTFKVKDNKYVEIEIRNLSKYCDVYQQRKRNNNNESSNNVQSGFEQCAPPTPHSLFPIDNRRRIKKKPPINPPVGDVCANEKPTASQGNERSKKKPHPDDAQVEEIYQAYPKHVSKKAALKAIAKALKEVDYETLLAATKEYASSEKVATTPVQFIKEPASWFNQGCWEDDRSEWNPSSSPAQEEYRPSLYDEMTEEQKELLHQEELEIEKRIEQAREAGYTGGCQ